MSEGDVFWVFYNAKHKVESQPMSLTRAQNMIKGLKPVDIETWMVKKLNAKDWKPLKDFIENKKGHLIFNPNQPSLKSSNTPSNSPSLSAKPGFSFESKKELATGAALPTKPPWPLPKQAPEGSFANLKIEPVPPGPEVTGAERELKNANFEGPEQRRAHKRYELNVEVLVLCGLKSFRSTTQNISLSGVLLKNPMPRNFLNAPLEVVFIVRDFEGAQEEKLVFGGKLAGNLLDPRRLMFTEKDAQDIEKLKKLFARFELSFRKKRKEAA